MATTRSSSDDADRGITGLVLQFAVSGLLALVLVGIGLEFVLRQQGVSEALRDARTFTRVLAVGAVEPALDDRLVRGNRAAIARMDEAVRRGVLGDQVVRVKLWTRTGQVVYSDEKRLIGSSYALGADDLAVFRTGKVEAEVSDLERPENQFERGFGKLLEVYLPVRTPEGRPLLFETYMPYSSVTDRARRLWLAFLPALLVALFVLWLVQLPLAYSLARRLRARQREREALLVRAMEASSIERRRIAADLHDGAVQDLAGISYSLAAGADQLETTPPSDVRELLRRGARVTRETMRQLRSLLVEIYPPNLRQAGLEPALNDLLAPLRRRGLEAELSTDGVERLDADLEQLVFRTVQEALRNVADHAGASRVRVAVARDGEERIVTTVSDDGGGFDPAAVADRPREGHFGLSLLRDRAADLGGQLSVDSEPGRGTTIRLEVPDR